MILRYRMQKIGNRAVAFQVLEQAVYGTCHDYRDEQSEIEVVARYEPKVGKNVINLRGRNGENNLAVSVVNFSLQDECNQWIVLAHKALRGWARQVRKVYGGNKCGGDAGYALDNVSACMFEVPGVLKCLLGKLGPRAAVFQVYEQAGTKSVESKFKSSVGITVHICRSPEIDHMTIHLRGYEPSRNDNVSIINFQSGKERDDWLVRANIALTEWTEQFKEKSEHEQDIHEV